MMWFWLACSSSDMKAANDESTLGMDSGFYSDTGMMENDAAEDASPEVLPTWKKISVNIVSEEGGIDCTCVGRLVCRRYELVVPTPTRIWTR